MEEIQFAALNSLCQGSAFKLKDFWMNPTLTALTTPRNSFIYGILNEILRQLVPAGIPQHLEELHTELLFKAFKPFVDKSPMTLKIADLSFGFIFWLCACGISTFGFLTELISFRFWKHMSDFIGLLTLLTILIWKMKDNRL